MAADSTPTVLGRYEVVKHLATGGMAEVLLARTRDDQGHVFHVVVKRIRPDQAADAQFVEMFLDEARIAALLQHPNIVRVFDIAQDNKEFFFAMEYVHGEDLRRLLMEVHNRRDKLPISMVSSIVAGAAAGLHHAHVQHAPDGRPLHIVHRDVSPANILIGYDGSVKVADFGIAKAALRTVETRSGTLKGKVSYMSPEQVTGKSVDCRSDVFALGIVLYEVATARRLFKGDNDFLTMSAIVQGNIPRPSQFRPDLPRVLEEIIMTALAASPGDRFQSAEELHAALEQFMKTLGMRIAPHAIADYMKKLFGMRAQPWLVDDEPTTTTTIDFDGSSTGVVQPPDGAVREHAWAPSLRPSASAPIVVARTELAGPPPPEQLGPAWPEAPSNVAWTNESTPIHKRSKFVAVAIGTALATGFGTFVIVKSTSSSGSDKPQPHVEATAAKVEATAQPPPTPPEPEPEPVKAEPPPEPKLASKPDVKAKVEPPAKKDPPAVTKLVPPKKDPPIVAKKPPAKKPDKRPPAKQPAGTWDPNALFAPK